MDKAEDRPPPSPLSPASLLCLQEALAAVYWYKSDLRSFLEHVLEDRSFLPVLDWKGYKRAIVASLVGQLARNPDRCGEDLRRLATEVACVSDFSHLLRLDDGQAKALRARQAIDALRRLLHRGIADQAGGVEVGSSLVEWMAAGGGSVEVSIRLSSLRDDFDRMLSPEDEHLRGTRLRQLITELCALFDLEGTAFRLVDSRIEGALTLEGRALLFEARWEGIVSFAELLVFGEKLWADPHLTAGLFLSVNGFAPEATQALWNCRCPVVLIDSADVLAVLEERVDFTYLLLRKTRHAAETGESFLRVQRILSHR